MTRALSPGSTASRAAEKFNRARAMARSYEARSNGRVVNPSATNEFFSSMRLLQNADALTQPYRQHSWTYAAIKALASNIAQVPWRILTGDPDNPTVVQEGPWVDLFDKVNPYMEARAQLWESYVIWLSLSGEVATYKGGRGVKDELQPGEVPTELWPFDGKMLEPDVDKDTKLVNHWEARGAEDGRLVKILPHRLARVKYYNPYDPLRGLGPMQAAQIATQSDFKAQQFNEAFIDNDATPGGIIKHSKQMTDEQRKSVQRGFEDRHMGRGKRRKVAIFAGGLEWVPTGDSLRDMEFTGLRTMNREEVLAIYKVPESELSLHKNLNFATALSADRGFWTKTLIPIMRLIEDSLWVQLFNVEKPNALRRRVNRRQDRFLQPYHQRLDHLPAPDEDEPVDPNLDPERPGGVSRIGARGQFWGEFDVTTIEALRQNLDLKLATAQRMVGLGYPVNMVNDRLLLGMPDLAWGDIPWIGSGLFPLEQMFLPEDDPIEVEDPDAPQSDEPDGSDPSTPSPDEQPATEEEPTAVGEKGDSYLDKLESTKLYQNKNVDPKLARLVAKATFNLVKRQTKANAQAWKKTMREVNLRFEPPFRNRYRRYLIQLRSVQLARLRAVAKGEDPGDDRAGRDWSGVNVKLPAHLRISVSDLEAILFNEDRAQKRIKTQHHPLYVRITERSADVATEELGGNFAFDVSDPAMADVISDREEILADVPTRIRRRLARSLEAGLRNDETIAELADRIRAEFNVFGGAQSLTVARTEVASAQSATRHETFKAEGVGEHTWVTARDEAVRASHRRNDGVSRGIGETFPNGLIHPAEAGGPPGEIINCRCVVVAK